MAKKKKKNAQTLLADAEKFFQRGNYPLALKHFTALNKQAEKPQIAEKIEICRREIDALRAKELTKQGYRAHNKGNLQEALQRFKDAHALSPDETLAEKITALEDRLAVRNTASKAEQAEADGAYEMAAEAYARAAEADPNQAHLLDNMAACLVKAGRYEPALKVYENRPAADPSGFYNYGFALARTGRYADCLAAWEPLAVNDSAFADQKQQIRRHLAADLFKRMETSQDPVRLLTELNYLLDTAGDDLDASLLQSLTVLRTHAVCKAIKAYWDRSDFTRVTELLGGLQPPNNQAARVMIPIQAKAWFNCAQETPEALETMLSYWMTAIYSEEIKSRWEKLGAVSVDNVRERLIRAVEELIRRHAAGEPGKRASRRLALEKVVFVQLSRITANRPELHDLVCSAELARRTGKNEAIMDLIRSHRSQFKSLSDYLDTGGYFTLAGEALSLTHAHAYEAAVELVENLPAEVQDDEFGAYAVNRARFDFAVQCLKTGDAKFIRHIDAAAILFDIAPDFEKKFTDEVIAVEDWEQLKPWEDALVRIHQTRDSEKIRYALSLVMCRYAIYLQGHEKLNLKAFKKISEKALKIWPDNEMAQDNLTFARQQMEIAEMHHAFDRLKMGKASRIAKRSQYPETRTAFFEFIKEGLQQLQNHPMEEEHRIMIINELYAGAHAVNPRHGTSRKLKQLLKLHSDSD